MPGGQAADRPQANSPRAYTRNLLTAHGGARNRNTSPGLVACCRHLPSRLSAPRAYFGNPLSHALTWRLPHELEPPPPHHLFLFPSSRRRRRHHHPLRQPNRVRPSTPLNPTASAATAAHLPGAPGSNYCNHEAAHQRGRRRWVRARGPDRPQEPGRAARAPPRTPGGAGSRPSLRDGEPPRRVREVGPGGADATAAVP